MDENSKYLKNKAYARQYYLNNKENFKKYYETYKKRKQDKLNGNVSESANVSEYISKYKKNRLRYERKLQRLEIKKQAFIQKLTNEGWFG
jgi:hypothetical protein